MNNKIFILTGEIQTGKTSFLSGLIKLKPGAMGILTPVVNEQRRFFDIGKEMFFDMEALSTGEKLIIGKYHFSAKAFAKANDVLLDAAKEASTRYLVIDEIGPLEINYEEGFYHTLKLLLATQFNYCLLLVIRASMLNKAIALFGLHRAQVFTLEEQQALIHSL